MATPITIRPGSGTLSAVPNFSPEIRVIVGAAIIDDGRVLACERSEPAEVAGTVGVSWRKGGAG